MIESLDSFESLESFNHHVIPHTQASQMASIYQTNKREIMRRLLEINQLTNEMRSVFYGTLGTQLFGFPGCEYSEPTLEQLERQFKREAWGAMLRKLELRKYMSSKKQEELDRLLSEHRNSREPDPIDTLPDITEENIFNVMQGYMQCVPEFIDESIREEWKYWLPQRDTYATNQERWKVSRKIIMTHVMRTWDKWETSHRVRYDAQKHVTNLDNIFHLLDGQGFVKGGSNGPLHNALDHKNCGTGETEYFKFKCFKNGNLHLTVKRLDLLAKFNEVGCGEGTALPNPAGKNAKQSGYAPPPTSKLDGRPPTTEQFTTLDFFETPEPVAEIMLEIIDGHHAKPVSGTSKLVTCDYHKLRILEPSAGSGSLVAKLLDREPKQAYCLELDTTRAADLEKRFNGRYGARNVSVEQRDFLAVDPFPVMDVIAMNPPFSCGRDMWHVHHAAKFLNKTGILVSVMSPHWSFAGDKLSTNFREWLETVNHQWIELPPGSFRDSGTGTNAGLLVIRRGFPQPNQDRISQ